MKRLLSCNPLFKNLCRFHDVFRVKNYSRREIHSMRELRRFLRKRYFELTEDQYRKCVKFFRLYPEDLFVLVKYRRYI